jgi:hypothetical protein
MWQLQYLFVGVSHIEQGNSAEVEAIVLCAI